MGLIKKIVKFFDKAFFKLFTFHIYPNTLEGLKYGCYLPAHKNARKKSWSQFLRETYYKSIVILGLDGVGVELISRIKRNRRISAIYLIDNPNNIRSYQGINVYDISKLAVKSLSNVTYAIASTYDIDKYADIIEGLGIQHYYALFPMEAKKIHLFIRRGIIRLRYLVIPRIIKRHGYFHNYVWFPFAAFMRKHKIRPFYKKSYESLYKLKDIHKGERCFIIATGPSLRLEDVEALKDEYTFGVNSIFKLYDQTDWRPTYYAMCDPFVYPDYINKGYDMDIDSFSQKGAFFSHLVKRDMRKNQKAKTAQFIPFCMLDHAITFNGKSLKYSLDPLWGFYNLRTVVGFCMNLADYMGFKEIYVLGVDCDYVTHGQHFDSEKSPNLLEYKQLVMAQEFMRGAFKFVKEQTEPRNITIYNCTRGGALNVFPRARLEDVLGIEKIQHSIPLPTSIEHDEFQDTDDSLQTKVKVFEESEEIFVSIIMLTYNHEQYIRQALDSILAQKTTFRYEIVIGDDASTDNTAEIIREYCDQYPTIFNVALRTKNVGGANNAYDCFSRAKGKYIANLEGDDYWTHPYKLQRQIDFLESHPDYIGCVHSCVWVNADGVPIPSIRLNNGLQMSGDYTTEALQDGLWNLPGQTGTLTYRNIYLNSNDRYKDIVLLENNQCDRSIIMLLLTFGAIHCDPEPMSHYRFNIGSTTSHASGYTKDIHRKYKMIHYFNKMEDLSEQLYGERFSFGERKLRIFSDAVRDNVNFPNADGEEVIEMLIEESESPDEYRRKANEVLKAARLKKKTNSKAHIPSRSTIRYLKKRDSWNAKLTEKLNIIIQQNNSLRNQNTALTSRVDGLSKRIQENERVISGIYSALEVIYKEYNDYSYSEGENPYEQ